MGGLAAAKKGVDMIESWGIGGKGKNSQTNYSGGGMSLRKRFHKKKKKNFADGARGPYVVDKVWNNTLLKECRRKGSRGERSTTIHKYFKRKANNVRKAILGKKVGAGGERWAGEGRRAFVRGGF